MSSKKVILLCSHCSWKRVCEIDDCGLYELKSDSMSARKFRCPGCGRAIVPRKFPDPQKDLERAAREERIRSENEAFLIDHEEFQKKFVKEVEDNE
jgi:hypothetical protein